MTIPQVVGQVIIPWAVGRVIIPRAVGRVTILGVIGRATTHRAVGRVTTHRVVGQVTIRGVRDPVITLDGARPTMIMGRLTHLARCYTHQCSMAAQHQWNMGIEGHRVIRGIA